MTPHHAYLAVTALIGVVLPAFTVLTGNSTKSKLLASPDKKLRIYTETAAIQVLLVALVFVVMAINNDAVSTIGLSFDQHPIWLALLVFLSLFSLWGISRIKIDPAKADELASAFQDVIYILPASQRQYKGAIALAFAVGVCEEILFRGFLFWQLSQYIPLWPAVVTVNLLFALAHYQTKIKNAFFAFLLGMFWSVTCFFFSTLWIAIVTHILIDIYYATVAIRLHNTISSQKVKGDLRISRAAQG